MKSERAEICATDSGSSLRPITPFPSLMSTTFDTSHVRNVGEFFSQHYLDAVLESESASKGERASRHPWAWLLARVFAVDVTVCPLRDQPAIEDRADLSLTSLEMRAGRAAS